MFGNVVDEPVGDFASLLGTVKVGCSDAVVEGGADALLQQVPLVIPAKELQHHAGRENGTEGVGDSLPGDVRSRAVDGLEE